MSDVFAIDFGTTYTTVAVFKNNKPELFNFSSGGYCIPSNVRLGEPLEMTLSDGGWSKGVAFCMKLLLGRSYQEIQKLGIDSKRFGVDIKEQKDVCVLSYNDKEYRVEDVVICIFKRMKRFAERLAEHELKNVILSVPCGFNNKQRAIMQECGVEAGLVVTQMINEPTAAGLYAIINENITKGMCLVYDLGGGTFDVSIIELTQNAVAVMNSDGNISIGGSLFDKLIADNLIQKYKEHYPNAKMLEPNEKPYHSKYNRLLWAVRKCKESLSSTHCITASITLVKNEDSDLEEDDITETISEMEVEELLNPYIDKTIELTKKCISDAFSTLSTEEAMKRVTYYTLVGGSARLQMIQRKMKALLPNSVALNVDHNKDCVVKGCILLSQHPDYKDVIYSDVTRYAYALQTTKKPEIMIKKSTRIPSLCITKEFKTVRNYQEIVETAVLQLDDNGAIVSRRPLQFKIKPENKIVHFTVDFSINSSDMVVINVSQQNTSEVYKVLLSK